MALIRDEKGYLCMGAEDVGDILDEYLVASSQWRRMMSMLLLRRMSVTYWMG